MILWSLINPQHEFAMWLKIALKIIEFYIIWSTYGAFKLFEGIKKVKKIFIKKQGKALQGSKTF